YLSGDVSPRRDFADADTRNAPHLRRRLSQDPAAARRGAGAARGSAGGRRRCRGQCCAPIGAARPAPTVLRTSALTLDMTVPRDDALSRANRVTGPVLLVLAALAAIVVFMPPEGRIGVPVHDSITILLGPTAFALPLALAFVGVLMTVQGVRPETDMPR